MVSLSSLKPYYNHTFEDWGGTTSDDYRSFERKYRNYLKRVCNANGWELVDFSPNHYEFSCFVKGNDKFVYLSIGDVRYFHNEWRKDILIRHADNERDYRGHHNLQTTLEHLEDDLKVMFYGGDLSCGWAHIPA